MRITLGGGGTDVLWYSKRRGGAWISAAINKYVYVSLKKSNQPRIAINDETIQKNSLNIICQCFKLAKINDSLEVSIHTDVHPQSGLGGSGALEVGLLHALYVLKHKKISKMQLAKEATFIEINKLKMPVGPQDQYITALGGINSFQIDTDGKVTVESLNLSSLTLGKLERNLLFFSTGVRKDTSQILGDEKDNFQKKESSKLLIKKLDNIKEIGYLSKKFLISGKVDNFGKLLHEHWLLKKKLSNKVSSGKIDEWYNEAIKAGALGGKIMGAGGGGWFVFYASKKKSNVRDKMTKLGLIEQRVRFDWEGTILVNSLSQE